MNTSHMKEIHEIANQQWGLVTIAQVRKSGASKQDLLIAEKEDGFIYLGDGIYGYEDLLGYSSVMETQEIWLSLDPEKTIKERLEDTGRLAVVSHETAAEVYGIGDVMTNRTSFTIPAGSNVSSGDSSVELFYADMQDEDIVFVDGLPVTSALRTIEDLGKSGLEPGYLMRIIADALEKELVTIESLTERLWPIAKSFGAEENDYEAMSFHVKNSLTERRDLIHA